MCSDIDRQRLIALYAVTVDKGYLPYPAGPARQPSSLQRGSVQYLSLFPGDPTTPGKPSYKDSKRVTPTSIPGESQCGIQRGRI